LQITHEDSAMPLAAQQALGDQPLHSFSQRSSAHLQLRRELDFAELSSRPEESTSDRLAQLISDQRRRGLAFDRCQAAA
jgi:hypothetical protein